MYDPAAAEPCSSWANAVTGLVEDICRPSANTAADLVESMSRSWTSPVFEQLQSPVAADLVGLTGRSGAWSVDSIAASALTGMGSGLVESMSRSWTSPVFEQLQTSMSAHLTGLADEIGRGFLDPTVDEEFVRLEASYTPPSEAPQVVSPDLVRRAIVVSVVLAAVWLWSQMVFDPQLVEALGYLVIVAELAWIILGRGSDRR